MKKHQSSWYARLCDWQQDEALIKCVRTAVFIREQGIPAEMEWEAADSHCLHALALSGHQAIGTGRLLDNGMIGRMAVVAHWRRRGVATALLQLLLQTAKDRGMTHLHLHAQCAVIDFYKQFGFQSKGRIFQEADINHQLMIKTLRPSIT